MESKCLPLAKKLPPSRSGTALIAMAVLTFCSSVANATPVETAQGFVTGYFTGWNAPVVRVSTDFAFANPHGCIYSDSYITDPSNAGSELYNATLLTAFTAHKRVSLIIDGCYLNWPKIIGVNVWQ